MKKLRLYSTLGCHLCEDAKEVILPFLEPHNISLQEIDIADSDELIGRYGVRIPVVVGDDSGDELNWPFDGPMFEKFLLKSINHSAQ